MPITFTAKNQGGQFRAIASYGLVFIHLLAFAIGTRAANVTLTASDSNGTSTSFNSAGNWSNGQAPSTANDYFSSSWLLRTPSSSAGNSNIFAGNSLSLDSNAANPITGLAMKFTTPPGSIRVNNLVLNGGGIFNGVGGTMSVFGNISVMANSFLDPQANGRTLAVYSTLSGANTINVREWFGTTPANSGGIVLLLGDNAGFTGNWNIWGGTNGAVLQVGNGGASGSLGSGNVTNNYSLVFNRQDNLVVDNFICGTGGVAVTGGLVTLKNTNTYSGPTFVNAGTLFVNGSLASTNSLTVSAGATLGGVGIINGPVAINGRLAPGNTALGTLTLAKTLTLSSTSTSVLRLQKSGGMLTNDLVKTMADLNYNGTLIVTATGESLALGDKITLFAKTSGVFSGGFVSNSLPALPDGLNWDLSGLLVDGSLKVVNLTTTPFFTPPPGTYIGARSVTISSDSGSTIFYTIDGSNPTNSPARQSGASPISGIIVPANTNLLLRAYATNSGRPDSLVSDAVYTTKFPPESPKIIKVYLQGGQSNSDGRATTNGLPGNLLAPQHDVLMYYYLTGGAANNDGTLGTLTTLRPGLSAQGSGALFGPELTFGRALADYYASSNGVSTNTVMVALIKYAHGGTSLVSDWAANGSGLPNGDGPDYMIFQQVVRAGMSNLAAAYPASSLELDGMIWVQGETDIDQGASASAAYGTNLVRFISDVRLTYATNFPYGTNLPFFLSRISTNQTYYSLPADSSYGNYLVLRTSQALGAASLSNANVFMVNIEGPQFTTLTPFSVPGLHFDTAGQQAIGNAFAQAVRNALPPPHLQAPILLENGLNVTFTGVTGTSHVLLSAPSAAGAWTLMTNITLGPLGLTNYLDQSQPGTSRFYRVRRP